MPQKDYNTLCWPKKHIIMLKQFFDNFIRFRFVQDKVRRTERETESETRTALRPKRVPIYCYYEGRAKNSKQINKTSLLQRKLLCGMRWQRRETERGKEWGRERNYFIAAACCRQGSGLREKANKDAAWPKSCANKSTQQNVSKCAIYLIFSTRCWYGIDLSRFRLGFWVLLKSFSHFVFSLSVCVSVSVSACFFAVPIWLDAI